MNKTDKPTASANVRVWGLHSRDYIKLPVERYCAAIGWDELGDLSKLPRDREAFKRKYAEVYKDRKPSDGHISTNATQLLSFVWEAKVGDVVAYPEKQTVHIGRIIGDYCYHGNWTESYRNAREVEWVMKTERQSLSKGAQNALKNLGSFFAIGENAPAVKNEFLECVGLAPVASAKKSREESVYESIYAELSGDDFERFVADLFRLYGYEVETTAKSGDHGIDLVATRTDALFTQRSVVQVKCCRGKSPEAEVQQLAGVLKGGERGVFVSYAGFQKAAEDYAREKGVALIDGRRVCTLALWNEGRLSAKWPQVFTHGK